MMKSDMSKRELIAEHIGKLSDQELDRVLEYLRSLPDYADVSLPRFAAESALAKDWLSPEEDAAWASL